MYLMFTISSTRGVRNDTFFSAGNRGRKDILRMLARGCRGLFARTEFRTCDIEYGMVAEFKVEAELTDDELGVLESRASLVSAGPIVCDTVGIELSMDNFGLLGLPIVASELRSGS